MTGEALDWSAGILACMSVASTRKGAGIFTLYAAVPETTYDITTNLLEVSKIQYS